jgi:hypothetical protein
MMRRWMIVRVSMPILVVVLLILSSCSEDNPTDPKPLPDNTPPAAITNLAAAYSTMNSVTLTWTAPGDDGNTGTAAQYDIRYALSPITETNWDSVSQVSSEPAPKAAGATEIFAVSGLSEDTEYYFVVKTTDEKSNWSALSNVATRTTQALADVTPPAAIEDLAVSDPTLHSVTLTWTAPGDDGTTGTAHGYDIRYSNSSIDGTNWVSAVPFSGEPSPSPAGSAEQCVVANLPANTGYYFAMKSTDEKFNKSDLSNVVSTSTLSCTGCWLPLGTGMARADEDDPGVTALAVYDGQLIAGGNFDYAGGVSAHQVAAWTGDSWNALGSGPNNDDGVNAIAVYDGDLLTGSGYDSGRLLPVSLWNGSSWSTLAGMYGNIFSLAPYNNQLIAGGIYISSVGGTSTKGIAAWNGSSWSPLGTGLFAPQGISPLASALAEYDGKLIAAGYFTIAGGVAVNSIAAWDGSSWSPLGSGLMNGSYAGSIWELAVYDGNLIAAGYFSTAGGSPAINIAAWDGSSWSPLGQESVAIDGGIGALAVYNGRLIAGGNFTSIGSLTANHIAAWDGSTWSALGDGTNNIVSALTVYEDQLIAGGYFTTAGGYPANCIATWKD